MFLHLDIFKSCPVDDGVFCCVFWGKVAGIWGSCVFSFTSEPPLFRGKLALKLQECMLTGLKNKKVKAQLTSETLRVQDEFPFPFWGASH